MVVLVKAEIFTLKDGSKTGEKIELHDSIFSIPYDSNFMSMYFARMKKASYIPTNKTKNISEISGTTKKPFKQKHTGNARQGSMRSAQMRGGGIAFGPRAVKRFVKIPKGETFLAKAMLFSKFLNDNKLFVIDDANFSSNKTKSAKSVLSNFTDKTAVIVNCGDTNVNSLLAVRNLRNIKFVSNDMLTAYDLISVDAVLIDKNTIENYSKVLNNSYESNNN